MSQIKNGKIIKKNKLVKVMTNLGKSSKIARKREKSPHKTKNRKFGKTSKFLTNFGKMKRKKPIIKS